MAAETYGFGFPVDWWGKEEDTPDAVGDDSLGGWQPLDLTPVLDGTWQPPQPTVGARSDGVGLFYPGRMHTVASETEAGKTWFALAAAHTELAAGHHVVFIDFEDDAGGIVGRLLTIGANRDQITDQFRYLRPDDALGAGCNRYDLAAALDPAPSLVVLDGITEAMTLHGLDPLSNSDAALFGHLLPRQITATGAAVVSLDHVTKAADGRGRYALGAVHKINGLTGAAYVLENRTPFGAGTTGRSTIRLAKDRPAQLRRHALPSGRGGMHWFADLVIDSHPEGFAEVTVEAPTERSDDWRPTVMMERVAKALDQYAPLSGARLEQVVMGKSASIREALTFLIIDGYASGRTPHELLKPYPENGDHP